MILPTGARLGPYDIVALLGTGASGDVYQARDSRLGRDVAIKTLRDQAAGSSARLVDEARHAATLNHPNVCTIHEIEEGGEQPFIVMELVTGRRLTDLVPTDGLTPRDLLSYGVQVAAGLAHAHDRGIIHRDLKSVNVMVTAGGVVKILDFGLARQVRVEVEGVTHSKTLDSEDKSLAGTLPYMAPELFRGAAPDMRSDVWALGVLLYEMATGRLPFMGATGFDLSAAIIHNPVDRLPRHVPGALRGIVERCLAKDPAARYPDATAVHAALHPVQQRAQARPSSRWRRALVPAGVLLTLALLATAAVVLRGPRPRWELANDTPSLASIVVLPLQNRSGSADQDYLADGVTEALISELARIKDLRVISRTSSMRYKATTKSLAEIAGELKVEGVLEGWVASSGNRVRVAAQLVDVASDRHVWSDTYDRELRDLLDIQHDVAQAVSARIRNALSPLPLAANQTAPNPEAHVLYLKARYQWNKRTPEGLKAAVDLFQQTIAIDADHAAAFAGLADCYTMMSFWGVMPGSVALPLARRAALRAIEIDDTLGEAYISLGEIEKADRHDAVAERAYRRGLELNPNYATGYQWYGSSMSSEGRHDEARRSLLRALELDPLSLVINAVYGIVLYHARDYEASVQQYRKTLELDPSWWPARQYLSQPLIQLGRHAEAISELEAVAKQAGRFPETLAFLAYAYGVAGRQSAARQIIPELTMPKPGAFVDPHNVAMVHAGLDDRDLVLDWLERAERGRSYALATINVDPIFDRLRDHPRFQAIVRKLNSGS